MVFSDYFFSSYVELLEANVETFLRQAGKCATRACFPDKKRDNHNIMTFSDMQLMMEMKGFDDGRGDCATLTCDDSCGCMQYRRGIFTSVQSQACEASQVQSWNCETFRSSIAVCLDNVDCHLQVVIT